MGWTSTKQNITRQLKLSAALVLQFLWQCCGSEWWSQRTPSPPRRWGQRTTISRGRDGAAVSPSTWRRLPAGLNNGSPPAWSETTRGWDSASQGARAPHPTAQETRWDRKLINHFDHLLMDQVSVKCSSIGEKVPPWSQICKRSTAFKLKAKDETERWSQARGTICRTISTWQVWF